jgi:hypothetical protein
VLGNRSTTTWRRRSSFWRIAVPWAGARRPPCWSRPLHAPKLRETLEPAAGRLCARMPGVQGAHGMPCSPGVHNRCARVPERIRHSRLVPGVRRSRIGANAQDRVAYTGVFTRISQSQALSGHLPQHECGAPPRTRRPTCSSPPAGKPDNERAHPLGDERGVGGRRPRAGRPRQISSPFLSSVGAGRMSLRSPARAENGPSR